MAIDVPSLAWLRWRSGHGFRVSRSLVGHWRGKRLVVPAGMVTDLASIPRLFRSVVPQVADHLIPALFHDAACEGLLGLTRAEADQMFLDFMEASGVGRVRRYAMFSAVRGYALATGATTKGGADGNPED